MQHSNQSSISTALDRLILAANAHQGLHLPSTESAATGQPLVALALQGDRSVVTAALLNWGSLFNGVTAGSGVALGGSVVGPALRE